MIFQQEMVEKILAGQKTVTRRPVKEQEIPWGCGEPECPKNWQKLPCRYEAGKTYAVQPVITDGPGKGRGGKEVARIRVTSVRRIPLGHQLTISEAAKEGFDGFRSFRDYWENLYNGPGSYDPTQLVDRIEFELLPQAGALEAEG